MNQYMTLVQKEWKENWRNFKFIWVPLVFVLLGISDAIMNYFMEDILSSVGNLPEGMEIIMPEFKALDIYAATTGQFQSIGLIVLVAIFASSISRERQSGTGTLLYVRPLSYVQFYFSKWSVAVLLALISVVLGYFGSFYYTTLLYEKVDFTKFLAMVGTYLIWVMFAVTFALTMSAVFKTSIAMALSIVVIPVFLMIDSLIGSYWTISPWKLGNYGLQVLADDVVWRDYWMTMGITVIILAILITIGITMSKKNAATTKI